MYVDKLKFKILKGTTLLSQFSVKNVNHLLGTINVLGGNDKIWIGGDVEEIHLR